MSWPLMPQVLMRTARFVEQYDAETAPHEITDLVQTWFVLGDKRLGLWVVTEDNKVIGHLLATPEPMNTEVWKYMLIRQAEIDPMKSLHLFAKDVFDDVIRWAKSFGLSRLVMITHRNTEAMARAWLFKEYKTIMTRDL